jgi:hypothetical protein
LIIAASGGVVIPHESRNPQVAEQAVAPAAANARARLTDQRMHALPFSRSA